MGLLDDLVKLQFGKPIADAITAIRLAARESEAQEKVAPILQQLSQEPLTYENIATLARSIGQIVSTLGPEGLGTETFAKSSGALQSLSDLILGQTLSEARKRQLEASARYDVARAQETERATNILDSTITPTEFTPKGLHGATYRQALHSSEVDKIYMPWYSAMLSVRDAAKQEKQRNAEIITSLLVKHLGPDYARYLPQDVESLTASSLGDVKRVAGIVIKNKYPDAKFDEKGFPIEPSQRQEMDAIIERVVGAYGEYASSKTGVYQLEIEGNRLRSEAYKQAVESVDRIIEMNPSLAPMRSKMIDDAMRLYGSGVSGRSLEADELRQIIEKYIRKDNPSTPTSTPNTPTSNTEELRQMYERYLQYLGSLPGTERLREEYERRLKALR